ncbi:MAG: gliding motility-associated C-terminal domain-containing protein [Bacteroidia bacterium]
MKKKLKDNNNIDKLLKETFEGFNPEPPAGIWQQIQQQLPTGNMSPNANNPINQPVDFITRTINTVKSITVITKTVVGIVAVATTATVLYFANTENEIPPKNTYNISNSISESKTNDLELNEKTLNDETIVVNKSNSSTPNNSKSSTKENPDQYIKTNVSDYESVTKVEPNKEQNLQEIKTNKTQLIESAEKIKQDANQLNNYSESENIAEDIPSETNVIDYEEVIPNVFTPNGDGRNDVYNVKISHVTDYHIVIFNTKNEVVFETKDIENSWDGKHYKSGINCETGTYHYVLRFKVQGSEEIRNRQGFIKLMR